MLHTITFIEGKFDFWSEPKRQSIRCKQMSKCYVFGVYMKFR